MSQSVQHQGPAERLGVRRGEKGGGFVQTKTLTFCFLLSASISDVMACCLAVSCESIVGCGSCMNLFNREKRGGHGSVFCLFGVFRGGEYALPITPALLRVTRTSFKPLAPLASAVGSGYIHLSNTLVKRSMRIIDTTQLAER